MKKEDILIYFISIILGIFIVYLIKNECNCKLIEGQRQGDAGEDVRVDVRAGGARPATEIDIVTTAHVGNLDTSVQATVNIPQDIAVLIIDHYGGQHHVPHDIIMKGAARGMISELNKMINFIRVGYSTNNEITTSSASPPPVNNNAPTHVPFLFGNSLRVDDARDRPAGVVNVPPYVAEFYIEYYEGMHHTEHDKQTLSTHSQTIIDALNKMKETVTNYTDTHTLVHPPAASRRLPTAAPMNSILGMSR